MIFSRHQFLCTLNQNYKLQMVVKKDFLFCVFPDKVNICFILTPNKDECDHVAIRLPAGEIFDGGIGIHTDSEYSEKFIVEDMFDYDEALLEKWSYGLDREYPRFCPDFNRDAVRKIIRSNLKMIKGLSP